MKSLTRFNLAKIVASHLPRQRFVNLGIGAPTHIGDYLPEDSGVMLHSENGILNLGPKPAPGEENWNLINAGKMPVTLSAGGSFFDSCTSFSMMRGGHIDIAVLGAFQVSEQGDLANWSMGDSNGEPPAVGGAVDLAVGAKAIWVMMDHVTRDGAARIVKKCTLPLTATRVVSRIFTNIAIIDVTPEGMVVDSLLEDLSFDEVQNMTGAELTLTPRPRKINIDGTMLV